MNVGAGLGAPRRWLLRLPAHVLNGASVSVGLGLVQVLVSLAADGELAQAASVGAVLASLPHRTNRPLQAVRRTLVGGLLASLVTLVVLATAPWPVLCGFTIALVTFVALLGMAWGPRAAPIVFSVTLGMIFSLARPSGYGALALAWATALGVLVYVGWALVSQLLLERRYRALAVADAMAAAASLLEARAKVLTQPAADEETESAVQFKQLKEELRLAEALQAARDLVYPVARQSALEVGALSRLAELREIVLTSRLDLDRLGHDHGARFVRARLASGLRRSSDALKRLSLTVREGSPPPPPLEPGALPDLTDAEGFFSGDERALLLPVVAARLRYLHEEVEGIRALLHDGTTRLSLRPSELASYVSDDDTWSLSALRSHLAPSSPVLRHALRSALALGSVFALSHLLPWATRPYWMLLSVAVVLRGTLDDTLSRRNWRVLGTLIGCVAAAVLLPIAGEGVLKLLFVVAVGVAHAFINVRYLLTAIAATIMALLQAHFTAPTTAAVVLERIFDTLLGALLAWGFSYVLPSWERRTLPAAIERALAALRDYSRSALDPTSARAEQRLARQRAYDALATVSGALERSAAEPERVRPPVKELIGVLDHAQRLMAHLSSLRALLQRRGEHLAAGSADAALAEARAHIDRHLGSDSVVPVEPPRVPDLPGVPPDQDPRPWLLRRLGASVHDASLAGVAAREALRQLRAPA